VPDARVPAWLGNVPPTDHDRVTMSADAATALAVHVAAGALPLFAPDEEQAARALIEGIFQWDPRSLHQRRRAAASATATTDADVHAVRLSRLLLRVRFRPGHAHVETLVLAPDKGEDDDEGVGEEEGDQDLRADTGTVAGGDADGGADAPP
jgi:hypothetical protein